MNRKLMSIWILVVAFAFLFQDCSKSPTVEKITLGAVLPLSGPIASYGKNSKDGVDLALEEINAQGNLKIQVVFEDDAGDVKNAVSAAQKLISSDKVPLIIGEASSGFSVALSPICNVNKVILISPVSSAAELTEKGGDYFFRVCPSDAFQARILSKWIVDEKHTSVSMLYVNSNWGVSLKDEFLFHYLKMGGRIVATEQLKEGDRDFRSQISKLNVKGVSAIVAFTPPKEGGPFVRQARELGVKLPLFGGDFWGTTEFLESGGVSVEGIYFTFPASPKGAIYDQFVSKFKQKFGKDPDIYASYSYDLMHIVANGLRSGARSGEQLKDYLFKMSIYEGVTGPTNFDKYGDVVTKTFDRKTIKNGKYIVIGN
jgi:branched-chain amino acid transport system substrate-binding protein